MNAVEEWLKKEVAKARIARARRYTCKSGDQLFLLERALKAEATARVLRKVLKLQKGMREDNMKTIINAWNLLGDSLYTLQPIKQYLDEHTSTLDNIVLVSDKGITNQMFHDTFPKMRIFDDIESALAAFPSEDLRVIPLGAGASGHICFTSAANHGKQLHISEGYAQILGMKLKEPPLPYAPWNNWEPYPYRDIHTIVGQSMTGWDLPPAKIRIAIAPFSKSCSRHTGETPNKTIDDWKWMHLINYLRLHVEEFRVLGGPKDRLTNVTVSEDEYWCASSFEDLRKKLKSLTLLITVDNGLGHMASALDVPTVILWPRVSSLEFIGPLWAPRTKYIAPIDPTIITPSNILNGLRVFVKDAIDGNASR